MLLLLLLLIDMLQFQNIVYNKDLSMYCALLMYCCSLVIAV